ncbi:ABC transporter substrate-binding protein [Nesterenkonia sp. LB17]|uniref:ABC transporter substrate-binding protein n=1 Tax=unclassified Nesterenkonia TaxID=2629769 RepID=UPI001F4CD83B|nr:ABC transporter substrate-binding protein [Nesterenkonia sp. DZ6]MCH8561944.1 ABC transporter substrate-binding protein [Nesterenkonia sp. YGD6]MCH8564519.1 ABC transporter substrate-binding protein [Nesterenkonia sp. LB17]
MKLRKLSAATAILATGALVLSGCTPGGDNDDAEAEETSNGENGGNTDAITAEGQQFTTEPEDTGKADTSDLETMDDEISVSIGETEFISYQGFTPETYSTYNSVVVNRLFDGFGYWGTDNVWYPNEDFGSYEVTSEDPFTVEYTIGEDVSWSDGTPVTVADYVLDWAYQNAELTNSDDEPLFNGISQTYGERVLEGPQGDPEGKTFTIEYTEPFADWEILVGSALPAHVVAEQSDMELDELVTAVREADTEALEPAAEFWNDGWFTDPGEFPDEELIPVTGPYKLDNWQAGESLTITANEEYWGSAPGTERIVYRFVNDGQHVQALENGDLNIARPQATVDTRGQLERLEDDFVLHEGEAATWEHLDFNFNDGAFSDSLELREAFAMCVPRQQIVSNLIEPVNPEASVLNARESLSFEENYEEIVSESYEGTYDEVDVEGAREILEAEDAVGTEVRIGYAGPNPRRTDTVAEIQASCDEAGFEIVDEGSEDFFAPGGALETGDYEVALFAWAGSGQVVSGQNIYSTDRPQNYGGYSNETVDDLFNQLATTEDADEQQEIIIGIEQELWGDLFGIPLYVHPQLSGSDITISNVRDTASQDQIMWNAEQWQRAE